LETAGTVSGIAFQLYPRPRKERAIRPSRTNSHIKQGNATPSLQGKLHTHRYTNIRVANPFNLSTLSIPTRPLCHRTPVPPTPPLRMLSRPPPSTPTIHSFTLKLTATPCFLTADMVKIHRRWRDHTLFLTTARSLLCPSQQLIPVCRLRGTQPCSTHPVPWAARARSSSSHLTARVPLPQHRQPHLAHHAMPQGARMYPV
jgi:hypothetical protein